MKAEDLDIKNKSELKPSHYKALTLWEEGLLSIKKIAKACKFSEDQMYHLFEGNSQKAGQVAHLFKAEMDKITARTAVKNKQTIRDNKKQSLYLMNARLKDLRAKEIAGNLTQTDTKEVVSIMNALNKATPTVEIGSYHSLSIHKDMSSQELMYEFERIRSIADNAFNPRGVQEAAARDAGRVSPVTKPRGRVSEEPEDPLL
jgi:hypothetical protein